MISTGVLLHMHTLYSPHSVYMHLLLHTISYMHCTVYTFLGGQSKARFYINFSYVHQSTVIVRLADGQLQEMSAQQLNMVIVIIIKSSSSVATTTTRTTTAMTTTLATATTRTHTNSSNSHNDRHKISNNGN